MSLVLKEGKWTASHPNNSKDLNLSIECFIIRSWWILLKKSSSAHKFSSHPGGTKSSAELSSVQSTLPWIGPFPFNIPQNSPQGLGPQASFGAGMVQCREQNLWFEQIHVWLGGSRALGCWEQLIPALGTCRSHSGRKWKEFPERAGFARAPQVQPPVLSLEQGTDREVQSQKSKVSLGKASWESSTNPERGSSLLQPHS